MSRSLIIVMDLTSSAAGIVYKRLIHAMQKYKEYDVLCPSVDDYARQSFNILPCKQYKRLHYRLSTLFFNGLDYILMDKLWTHINKRNVLNLFDENHYDSIISFVYGGNTAPLILGNIIKNRLNLPWVVYSVDALPTPISWTNNFKQFNGLYKHLERYILSADALYWANPIMKEYEEKLFEKYNGKYGIVLTPGEDRVENNLDHIKENSPIFLYAGQIYGPRKIDALLSGFDKYLKVEPNAKLIFVGHCGENNFTHFYRLVLDRHIEIYPFSNDVEYYYQRADILIDINADVENDVFLSSKICNYLSYDKPILTISQEGSPVRNMMSGYNTIVHCHHDDNEVLVAMQQAVYCMRHYKDDREDLRLRFSALSIAKEFCDDIDKIIDNYTANRK